MIQILKIIIDHLLWFLLFVQGYWDGQLQGSMIYTIFCVKLYHNSFVAHRLYGKCIYMIKNAYLIFYMNGNIC